MSEHKKKQKLNLSTNDVVKKLKEFITNKSNWGTLIGFHQKEAIAFLYNDDFQDRKEDRVAADFYAAWNWLIEVEVIQQVNDGVQYPMPYYQYVAESKTWIALLKDYLK